MLGDYGVHMNIWHLGVPALGAFSSRDALVAVGVATFFFGFGGAALLSIYLSAVSSPLVAELRSSLSYKSSIFGDGLILPAVNMFVLAFLRSQNHTPDAFEVTIAIVVGGGITAYFHVTQATKGLVNWTMPTPWHWNILGLWHALYMLAVASLLSLFYVAVIASFRETGRLPIELPVVSTGLVMFFVLLRLDYVSVSLRDLIPRFPR